MAANPVAVSFALVLFLVGLGFKLSFVPVHFWVPDIYQGAPAPVSAFLSTVTKVAAFGLLINFLAPFIPSTPPTSPAWTAFDFRLFLSVVGIITMIAGNFAAATQSANMQKVIDRIDLVSAGDSARAGLAWAPVLQSAMARRGVKASGERAELRQRPVGWVLADVMCVLASCGHSVRRVQQGTHGCELECVIAPGWRVLIGGTLVVTVERTGQGTGIRAIAHLPGLIRDWGTSRQILDQIFCDIP